MGSVQEQTMEGSFSLVSRAREVKLNSDIEEGSDGGID